MFLLTFFPQGWGYAIARMTGDPLFIHSFLSLYNDYYKKILSRRVIFNFWLSGEIPRWYDWHPIDSGDLPTQCACNFQMFKLTKFSL